MSHDRPAAVTPPRFADPRRVGAVIGLAGACLFVFSYSTDLATPLAIAARTAVVVLAGLGLWNLFARPRWLGHFVPAKPSGIAVYLLCVVAEFALIAVGTRWLTSAGNTELRPSLIALVVGLHFIPFAWAFRERMFYLLGGALVVLGGVGLIAGTGAAARSSAVLAGIVMAILLLAYSRGTFAGSRRSAEPSPDAKAHNRSTDAL
ncbi:hypothetical protein LWF01_14340 [Saxibacter everestensis]|uniref:EamA domain-containing protein n=1 Tax=Saxibacter everestensis TaxID=2909229 RepID=A0ABY8QQJ7_9MICO|nr:hypothetical protein LWF01_14340 [Brevibacteriaceae bacterium ZFBP1038]